MLTLQTMCLKLNGILEGLGKQLVWSVRVDNEVISLLQYDKKRELTQTMLSGDSKYESYLFLKGYYLAMRDFSMSA